MSAEAEHEHYEKKVRIEVDGKTFLTPSETTGAALYALAHLEPGEKLFRDGGEGEGGHEHLVPNDRAPLRVHDGEQFHVGHSKDRIEIIVNARQRVVPAGRITYEDVVALAFDAVPEGMIFSVTYHRGPHANPDGELALGGSVKVKKGMVFDVTPANRS